MTEQQRKRWQGEEQSEIIDDDGYIRRVETDSIPEEKVRRTLGVNVNKRIEDVM